MNNQENEDFAQVFTTGENEDFQQVFVIGENEDFDEQVFTVGENEGFRANGEGSVLNTTANSSLNSLPILIALALVVFLPITFIIFVASPIIASITGIFHGDLVLPLSLGCVLVAYIAMNICANSSTNTATPPPLPTTSSISNDTKGKKKKFKNLQEHRMYLKNMGHDVDNDPRFQNCVDKEQPAQTNNKKVADEIELAVDALIKLGFGFKKAKDWVMRGIADGISTSDTQSLIKYALSRGASHQNRKNK